MLYQQFQQDLILKPLQLFVMMFAVFCTAFNASSPVTASILRTPEAMPPSEVIFEETNVTGCIDMGTTT